MIKETHSNKADWNGVLVTYSDKQTCFWTLKEEDGHSDTWLAAIFNIGIKDEFVIGECSTFNAPYEWDLGKNGFMFSDQSDVF